MNQVENLAEKYRALAVTLKQSGVELGTLELFNTTNNNSWQISQGTPGRCVLKLNSEIAEQLLSNSLNAQQAFTDGLFTLTGDTESLEWLWRFL